MAALTLAFAGCVRDDVDRVEWTSMGTIAAVQRRGGTVPPSARDAVKKAFAAVESEFSAFDENSAIRKLGRCTEFGRPCMDAAMKLKEQSGGAFDPEWKRDGTLDFGAIAKGFAIDLAAEKLENEFDGIDALVDLGGNLKAVGGDWRIGILGGGEFVLASGAACATSAKYFRGEHIADARSGNAATNGCFSVTVVHPSSAMIADGLSTTLFILGKEKGAEFVEKHYPEAKVFWSDAGF